MKLIYTVINLCRENSLILPTKYSFYSWAKYPVSVNDFNFYFISKQLKNITEYRGVFFLVNYLFPRIHNNCYTDRNTSLTISCLIDKHSYIQDCKGTIILPGNFTLRPSQIFMIFIHTRTV